MYHVYPKSSENLSVLLLCSFVTQRVARIEALLFPKQEMTKKVSGVERTPRRRDASLVGRLPSFTVSPIEKP